MRKHAKRIIGLLSRSVRFSLFTILLLLFPSSIHNFEPLPETLGISNKQEIHLPPAPPIPVNKDNVTAPFVTARGVLIKDMTSGVVLYEKSETSVYAPASTTKIMTAFVALDHYQLDDVLTAKTVITEGRVMGLLPGETLTFESLLYGMLVHSANDAAFTVAENFPGGVLGFVERMNKKAEELHLAHTYFTNPIGFDDPSHVTTAGDLAVQALVAMSNKTFAKIVGTRAITVSDTTYTYFHPLSNVNELLGKIAGLSGVKTGYTDIAGGILISEIQKNGRQALFIVLNSGDRFGETVMLINWVFENFTWIPLESIIPATQN